MEFEYERWCELWRQTEQVLDQGDANSSQAVESYLEICRRELNSNPKSAVSVFGILWRETGIPDRKEWLPWLRQRIEQADDDLRIGLTIVLFEPLVDSPLNWESPLVLGMYDLMIEAALNPQGQWLILEAYENCLDKWPGDFASYCVIKGLHSKPLSRESLQAIERLYEESKEKRLRDLMDDK